MLVRQEETLEKFMKENKLSPEAKKILKDLIDDIEEVTYERGIFNASKYYLGGV
jgi:hypothetical protein